MMTDQIKPQAAPAPEHSSRFPTAYTILFLLIVLVAALTWIIPAGTAVILDRLVCRRFLLTGFLSHRSFLYVSYDEPNSSLIR